MPVYFQTVDAFPPPLHQQEEGQDGDTAGDNHSAVFGKARSIFGNRPVEQGNRESDEAVPKQGGQPR
jgi:hypothetical protein